MKQHICNFCLKDKQSKYVLHKHLFESKTSCSMEQMKSDLIKIYETKLKSQETLHETKLKSQETLHETKIKSLETLHETKIKDKQIQIDNTDNKLKDKQLDLKIALRESDYYIKVKDDQIMKLENHIKEMTNKIIEKPTNQYVVNMSQTAEDYMKSKEGIHLNVLQCLQPKESKKIDLLILNGKNNNFVNYDYYNLLCSLIGQNVLLENIIVTDQGRGSVMIKYNNKTEYMTRVKTPFETSYELGKINQLIHDKVESKYKKFIKSNEFYINKLRMKLVKTDNRTWGDLKRSMVMTLS
jgi:hypothetical protein